MELFVQDRNKFFEQVLKTAKKQKRIHSYEFYTSTKYTEDCRPIGQTVWAIDTIEEEAQALNEKKNIYMPRFFKQKDNLIQFFQSQGLNVKKLEFVKTQKFRGKYYTTYFVSENLE